MIHILPRLEYNINSTKTPEDINAILNSVTVPGKDMPCDFRDAEFVGEVNPYDFKIIKKDSIYKSSIYKGNIYIKNSFKPVISGTIRTENGMSVIIIKMRLYLFVRISSVFWFGGVGIVVILSGLNAFLIDGIKGALMFVSSAAMFAVGEALVRIGFYLPAKKAIKRLEELLQ
ncbi:MAG: hypothetical protein NC321_16335 [Clostridium sp.]|nr:hypothetical protein [Clostridium sp.]